MADNETPDTQPEDSRPRPQYGELAPEGWVWKPPVDPVTPPKPPAAVAPSAPVSHNWSPPEPAKLRTGLPRPVPAWDRIVTLVLLLVGILGMFVNIAIIQSAPESIAAIYAQENLGDYAMADAVPTLITAAVILQICLFVAAAALSIWVLRRKRRAFFIPLSFGVLAALSNFFFIAAIAMTDPTLVSFYGAG